MMDRVYFDNAATTRVDDEVFEAMRPFLTQSFGNPSSTHAHGREVRTAIERARKKVAELINASTSEIFFTSGGTEADNMALCRCVEDHSIKQLITSPIEHHAVLHTAQNLAKIGKVKLSFVEIDTKGRVDMAHLETLLKEEPKSLVSIMHANNEIGTKNNIERIGEMCAATGACFHSDTVQTMGHFPLDMQQLKAHFIVGSGHKFHGPKGSGFIFVSRDHKIHPYIYGGAQERNMRGGTENAAGIVATAKALEIACRDMDAHQKHIQGLKDYMIGQLRQVVPSVSFNGTFDQPEESLYTVLSVSMPPHENNDMILFNLDINGVSASGGSACSSGAVQGSHVLAAIGADPSRATVRFSFSKYNTKEEVDFAVGKIAEIYAVNA